MKLNRILLSVIILLHFSCRGENVAPEVLDTVSFENAKARDLKEVVIKPKRQKYSKKNNPAVDLMEKVRHDRNSLDPSEEDYYSFDKYTKMVIALNEFDRNLTKKGNPLGKQFNFFENYIDTADWTGKEVLDLSLKEKMSTVVCGRNVNPDYEVVRGLRSHGLDDAFNKDNVRKVFEDVFREIALYDNNIALMQTRFVSPLSAIAADYYKYQISDTVLVAGEPCVELSFFPHTPEALGFNGKIFIPVNDSVKYVKRISMRTPKHINLNYVDNIFISQNYEKDSLGKIHKTLDELALEMQFVPGTPKLYGSRKAVYSGFSFEKPEGVESAQGDREIVLSDAELLPESFWIDNRPLALSYAESKMGGMMRTLRKQPFLYWSEKILNTFINGYITTGNPSKFNFGPLNTVISYNTAEGVRFRVGGMTTTALSQHWFANGYVAYGLRDHKVKYMGELEYSFLPKKYTAREFPVNSIKVMYQYDIDQLGQHYIFTNADNVFLSLKRKRSDLITYRRLAQLEYNLELRNNLSFGVQMRHESQEATRWITFVDGYGSSDRYLRQSVLKLSFRYAPGEKVVSTHKGRLSVNKDAPVILLTHEFGPKGFLGADFTLNKTELSAQKRFWLSSLGYTDIVLKGGIIWSQVQFPALLWQNANLSYTIRSESYALLNPMEFAMDKYASLDLTYFMNGLIFNRIPLIKKLKLREVFTFKGFVGDLSRKNNPEYNMNLYRFPADASVRPMGKKPYMEIGVGLDNILTILRVDYVWRLSYTDLPGVDRRGLRVSLHFSF
ncbi:MAG: carboxypeptidase-like regulatory domain-containing protein [Bacteroides sp.]|nr:carboxypeptidase-like regulatory domain-containing protein [Bacteroides sp.]